MKKLVIQFNLVTNGSALGRYLARDSDTLLYRSL